MTTPRTLVVSEVFGPTVQGEGPSTGQLCGFVRLGGCNLHCSWCDTPYTWDASRFDLRTEMTRVAVSDVLDQIEAMNVGLVVISGGEPMMQQQYDGWSYLLDGLEMAGRKIEVETNGTVSPTSDTAGYQLRGNLSFNVSPKLAHNGDPKDLRVRTEALDALNRERARFKFVCRWDTEDHAAEDVAQVRDLVAAVGIPRERVWLMPEGTNRQDILDGTTMLAPVAIAAGWNVTTRLHTLVWGDERKR